MHYYQFNIGDYIKHTIHLSSEEDICYRRLLDMYYDTELPIPTDIPLVSRRLRVGFDVVQSVLKEFFYLTDDGYRNYRADAEIAEYYEYINKQRSNGKLGGRPKKTHRKPTANPSLTQDEPKKSLNINHKPLTNTNAHPVGFAEFWLIYPKKKNKGDAEKAWNAIKPDSDLLDAIRKALAKAKASKDWQKDGGQFIPYPASWLRAKGWEDDLECTAKPSILFDREAYEAKRKEELRFAREAYQEQMERETVPPVGSAQ